MTQAEFPAVGVLMCGPRVETKMYSSSNRGNLLSSSGQQVVLANTGNAVARDVPSIPSQSKEAKPPGWQVPGTRPGPKKKSQQKTQSCSSPLSVATTRVMSRRNSQGCLGHPATRGVHLSGIETYALGRFRNMARNIDNSSLRSGPFAFSDTDPSCVVPLH